MLFSYPFFPFKKEGVRTGKAEKRKRMNITNGKCGKWSHQYEVYNLGYCSSCVHKVSEYLGEYIILPRAIGFCDITGSHLSRATMVLITYKPFILDNGFYTYFKLTNDARRTILKSIKDSGICYHKIK